MAKQVDTTYGNALFELALEDDKLDVLLEEAKVVIEAVKDNQDLVKFLEHPQISKDEKIKVIESIFKDKVSDDITGLLVMLVEKNHSSYIVAVLEYFVSCVLKEKNIGIANITSAVMLSDKQKADIENRLIETTHYAGLNANYYVDQSLIGGLVIRIEDRVVDSSIKTQIEKMSRTLVNA